MLADGGPGGPTGLRQCGDVGFSAGQGMQQGEASPVTEQCEKFRRERELFLGRGARMRIMCR